MKDGAFTKLVESIKQAREIKRGVCKLSRIFEFNPLGVKAIRANLRQSQRQFAQMIVVSVATLQSWEQRRRKQKIQYGRFCKLPYTIPKRCKKHSPTKMRLI